MFVSLAMMEMTLVLAHLYRRYDVCLVEPENDMELIQQFGLLPGKFTLKNYRSNCDIEEEIVS
jgi:cytochrome P450